MSRTFGDTLYFNQPRPTPPNQHIFILQIQEGKNGKTNKGLGGAYIPILCQIQTGGNREDKQNETIPNLTRETHREKQKEIKEARGGKG